MSSGGDLLGALPDDVLQLVLSFVPTCESVQTSTLSRRWRHIWRSTPAFLVAGNAKGAHDHALATFVDLFLLLRDGASPLRAFEMDVEVSISYNDEHVDLWEQRVDLWIRHAALTCRTLDLTARLAGNCKNRVFSLTSQPLATTSRNLTKLKLCNVSVPDGFLYLSRCCPALLELTLSHCFVKCEAIVSPSLHHLRVTGCNFMTTTTRISTPSLRRLHLFECCADTHTSLESMPSLTTATVWLPKGKSDSPGHCSLFHGLSQATTLKLIARCSDGQVIFQRELRWCPTFSNLKTLVLNEWCVIDDAFALACLLRHSPILENLIFEVTKYRPDPPKASPSNITLEPTTLQQLKTVEIKCQYSVCSWALKILKVLTSCGVPFSRISVEATNIESEAYNFVCTGISSKETE